MTWGRGGGGGLPCGRGADTGPGDTFFLLSSTPRSKDLVWVPGPHSGPIYPSAKWARGLGHMVSGTHAHVGLNYRFSKR